VIHSIVYKHAPSFAIVFIFGADGTADDFRDIYARRVSANLSVPAQMTHSILGAHGFEIYGLAPSFSTVMRTVKDAGEAVSL
jgi:hypothetical protein